MPTANFAAELFEIFQKGAREKLEIPMPDKGAAYALRFRLNKLRKEMRKEKHYMLEIAEGVSLVIKRDQPEVLIALPADQSYLTSIRQAIGAPSESAIEAQRAVPVIETEPEAPRMTSDEALSAFFDATKQGD